MFLYSCLYVCSGWSTRDPRHSQGSGEIILSALGGLQARALYIHSSWIYVSLFHSLSLLLILYNNFTFPWVSIYPAFRGYFELEGTGRDFSSSSILSSRRAISASMLSSFSLNISLYSWSESERSGIHLDSAIRCIKGFDVLCAFSICHASTRLKTLWPQ